MDNKKPEKKQLTDNQTRVLWHINLRWGAIALILSVVLYLKLVGRFEVPLLPCLAVTAIIATYNSLYYFLAKRYKVFCESPRLTDLRTIIDLIIITFLLHFTGGVESPFILLYLLELMFVSLFSYAPSAYYLAALTTIFYLSNGLLEGYLIIPHYRLSTLSGTLHLSLDYIFATSFALFLSSAFLVFMASYLSGKFYYKQKQIEELSNAKVSFMNDVIHEIKSPLTSIIGYSETLVAGTFGKLSEEQVNPLNVIKRQSERISNMVDNLLNLARMESGEAKINKNLISLSEIIARTIVEIKPELDGKQLDLIKELDLYLPPIFADETKISEVITNLLSNAVKFSKPKGKIYISTQSSGKEVQVSVRDEGLGIEIEDLPHIFEKFHRGNNEVTTIKGTGLGLALSKTIVEGHGGHMWVVSGGSGRGAVFHFTLPL